MDLEEKQEEKLLTDLLQYWQPFLWRNTFNQATLDLDQLPFKPQIVENINQPGTAIEQEDGEYWLVVAMGPNQNSSLVLWIPIAIKDKKLQLRDIVHLPWVPSCFFMPSSELYFTNKVLFEDFIKFDCVKEDLTYCCDDAEAFIKQCLNLLNQLSDQSIDQYKWLLFKQDDLNNIQNLSDEKNALLKRYAQLDSTAIREHLSEQNFLDVAHVHQAQFSDFSKISADYYFALQTMLSLKKGELQTINTPIGSPREELLSDIIANLYCVHALGKKAPPRIVSLGKPNLKPLWQINAFNEKSEYLSHCQSILKCDAFESLDHALTHIRQTMRLHYEEIVKTISLARHFKVLKAQNEKEFGEINQFLEQLILEDDYNDEKRQLYLNIQNQWRNKLKNHSFFQKCVGWLGVVKRLREKKASEFLKKALANEPIDCPYEQQLVEKIRQLKVVQAKNDRKRIQAVEFLNQLQKAQANWENWVKKLGGEEEGDALSLIGFNQILKPLRQKMWQLTALYWQGYALDVSEQNTKGQHSLLFQIDLTAGYQPFDGTSSIEYLVINDAQDHSPTSVLPLLNKSQKAIIMGDPNTAMNSALLTATQEMFYLKQLGYGEETIERLQIQGCALSYGDVFSASKHNSAYQRQSSCGLIHQNNLKLPDIQIKNKQLFDFYNQTYHHNKLNLLHPIEREQVDVSLSIEDVKHLGDPNQMFNPMEVSAIVDFFQRHINYRENTIVVTAFYQQAHRLRQALKPFEKVHVYTISEMPNEIVENVIFSSVYQESSKRPFVFDEGNAFFYKLFAVAKKEIKIFGDLAIFQAHTHSASGAVAKWVFGTSKQQLETNQNKALESKIV